VAADRTAYVLDSFALLAFLQGERGEPIVQPILTAAAAGRCVVFLSLINLGEILYILERKQGLVAAQRALAVLDQLPITTVPVSRAAVLAAAHVKANHAISYADAFAVAAAQVHGATLVTGDPEFGALANAGLIELLWLPQP